MIGQHSVLSYTTFLRATVNPRTYFIIMATPGFAQTDGKTWGNNPPPTRVWKISQIARI